MIVYKTTNKLNGKIYIGQCVNPKDSYLGSGSYFQNALRRYGKENFIRETLCECSTQEELNEKEIYWIAHYNSTDKKIGYNLSTGGGGASGYKFPDYLRERVKERMRTNHPLKGTKLSEERKRLISEQNRNRPPISEETRKKKSMARKGVKLTEEHKAKISQSHIGITATPEQRDKQSKAKQKPIIEYDLQMNIIKEWPSALIASKELEIPRTNIGRVLRLQQKSVQNKIFRYKEPIM